MKSRSIQNIFTLVRKVPFIIMLLVSSVAFAQLPITEDQFFSRITPGSVLPEKLLATRTVVFYSYNFTQEELQLAQQYFQRSGIDAVSYLDLDLVTSGRDVCVATAEYLNTREISNLIFLRKKEGQFSLVLVSYNSKANFVEDNEKSWSSEDPSFEALVKRLYLATASSLKRQNFLINDLPEFDANITPINGRRNEFFAVDLKIDPLAVPRFNDAEKDTALAAIMKNYPYKFTFTDPNLSESELRKKGFLYVLRFVNAKAKIAKSLMGYEMAKSETAVASISYPSSEPQLKNIAATDEVFKFYFKHIESQNVFLGRQWDADTSWQQALVNQIKAYRIEFKLN